MAEPTDYFLGDTLSEQDRLVAQAEGFEREARWLLDRIGIQPRWRALDVGCGPIGILPLLAERVGPQGAVVGLEREPRFAAMARSMVAKRGLSNVEVVQADANASGLPKESFDFAHERLVLILRPNPEALLAEMVALVRPGGLVAVEDIDEVSWFCYPPHPAWDTLLGVFQTICRQDGVDSFIGRRLPELLRAAGLGDVRVEVHAHADQPGEYRRTHLLSLLHSLHGKVIVRGLLAERKLAELMATLSKHLEDPRTIVVRQLLFQAWGRKPP